MNILDEILQAKQKEVATRKQDYPVSLLEKSIYYNTACVSLQYYISGKSNNGIIAEFKRRSPSKGWISKYADARQVSLSYMQAGAAALSVLTDKDYFGAQPSDFYLARAVNYCPILRKDFIIDEYQVIESKSIGADVILLIAKALSYKQVKAFTKLAHVLGMEVLLELQNEEEVETYAGQDIDMVGINNRNLQDFSVNYDNSLKMASLLPEDKIKIAESGITSAEDIRHLQKAGFKGFLVGSRFMQHSHPGQACKDMIKALNNEN